MFESTIACLSETWGDGEKSNHMYLNLDKIRIRYVSFLV